MADNEHHISDRLINHMAINLAVIWDFELIDLPMFLFYNVQSIVVELRYSELLLL